jgi:ABC transport system ATP-binding/permease protein
MSEGAVLLSGEPVAQRLRDIGYVPQNDTVHRWLSVEEALRYGAQLRLPDASSQEVGAAVDRVIAALRLEDLREQMIGSEEERPRSGRLSGGERKRACVAMEMLNNPSVIFLDEPTSPLDPWFGEELVQVLRSLAESRCSVVMVTHHHDDVPLCDKVAVLARGGYLCYYGAPAGALEYFGVDSYADIYRKLRERPGDEWAAAPGGEVAALRARAGDGVRRPAPPVRPRIGWLTQTRVLTRRFGVMLRRDRANLGAMTLSVPALALMFLVAFGRDVFVLDRGRDEPNAPTFLFFLTFVVVLLGVIAAFRELIKERPIFRRERAIGVGVGAYLASKYVVLGLVGAAQAVALGLLAFAFHPLHQGAAAYVGSLVVLVLTSLAGVSIGLLVSAVVRSQEQATTYIAIPLALQLFFGGSIIHPLTGAIAIPAAIMPSRWSFTGLGSFAKLGRIPLLAEPHHFGTMFSHSPAMAIGILAGLTVAIAAVTVGVIGLTRQ